VGGVRLLVASDSDAPVASDPDARRLTSSVLVIGRVRLDGLDGLDRADPDAARRVLGSLRVVPDEVVSLNGEVPKRRVNNVSIAYAG